MYTREQLEGKSLTALRRIARELHVPRRTVLEYGDLVDAILDAQVAQAVDGQVQSDDAAQEPDPNDDRFDDDHERAPRGWRDHLHNLNTRTVALSLMALGTVLLVACGILAVFFLFPDKEVAEKPKDKPVSEVEQVANVQDERDPRFVQLDVGSGELNKVVGEGLSSDTGEEITENLLEVSGHSAHLLAIYASSVGLWDDPNSFDSLLTEDKSYLSEKGIELWYSLKGALTAKTTKVEIGEAPANAINSGISGGKFGQSGRRGISGNRKAIIYTFQDGSKLYVLIRCGNIVYWVVQDLPFVPTDEECYVPVDSLERHTEGPATRKQPLRSELAQPTSGYTSGSMEEYWKSDQYQNTDDPTQDSGRGDMPAGSHGGGSSGTDSPTGTDVEDETSSGRADPIEDPFSWEDSSTGG